MPKMNAWKAEQRKLTERAGVVLIHKGERKAGDVLRFKRGVYEVQENLALKFLGSCEEYDAAKKKFQEELAKQNNQNVSQEK